MRSFPTDARAEIKWFSLYMEEKLAANEHKGRYLENGTLEYAYLVECLEAELEELKRAIAHDSPREIISEAADVANFALGIAQAAKSEHYP